MARVNEILKNIQSGLKVPKGNYNSFGNYKYRSCEDILEAVKPLLAENNAVLTLSDEIEEIGGRIYVKATATIWSEEGEAMAVSAFAREAESKKGMDESQLSGTASSYARKYALNGLFCIDDTRDADTDEYVARTGKNGAERGQSGFKGSEVITEKQASQIEAMAVEVGTDVKAMCEYFGVDRCDQMTKEMYAKAHHMLAKKGEKNG